MAGPLAGIRVLDLSRILAGPWSTQILADMGAEVIKVERPHDGDDTRKWGPPFIKAEDDPGRGDAAYYFSCNRNKRAIAVDLALPEGQQLIRDLAAKSDILYENYKFGGLKKYGLDYESLRKVNPKLIYCSITGFGQTGPYRARPGYDFLIQAMGGLMSLTGERDDLPGGGPQKAGVALADVMTGLYATIAVLGALNHRNNGGSGQHIDMALLDVQVATLANQASTYLMTGQVPGRMGNAHAVVVPYQTFQTKDGFVIFAIGNDGQFAKFCEVAGRPELATDERFRNNAARVINRKALIAEMEVIARTRTTDDWVTSLEAASVPCGPINTLDRVFADPQVQARGMKAALPHPQLGTVYASGSPLKFSETPVEYRNAPPPMGWDTAEVLQELLGLDGERLKSLDASKVIQITEH